MIFRDIISQNPCYPVLGTENVKSGDFLSFVERVVGSGIKVFQLREKYLDTIDFIRIAEQVVQICNRHDCLCIINDRVDVALAVHADGVHIGQSDMPYHMARDLMKDSQIIGLSLNSMEDVKTANSMDLDYVAINGVFPSSTKNIDDHIWNIEGLQIARMESQHTVIAIGGINEQNVSQISQLCDGFAVSSDICCASDPILKINGLVRNFYNII